MADVTEIQNTLDDPLHHFVANMIVFSVADDDKEKAGQARGRRAEGSSW